MEIKKNEDKVSDFKKILKDYDVDTKEKLDEVSKKLSSYIIKLDEKFPSRTIDANGGYSFENIPEGTYYIFLKSKNRDYISLVEIMGQIYLQKIKLNNGETKDVSKNFRIK